MDHGGDPHGDDIDFSVQKIDIVFAGIACVVHIRRSNRWMNLIKKGTKNKNSSSEFYFFFFEYNRYERKKKRTKN